MKHGRGGELCFPFTHGTGTKLRRATSGEIERAPTCPSPNAANVFFAVGDLAARGIHRLGRESDANASSTGGRYEMDVSHNTSKTVVGEPEIAIDPKNPNNIYVAWATFPMPVTLTSKAPPRSCGAAVSNDGGSHWHYVSPPVNNLPNITGCEDGAAVTGPDGTLYQSGDMATFTGLSSGGINIGGSLGGIIVHGQDWVTASKSWGTSWSKPVETMGSDATRFVRGGGTLPIDTFDRPWIAVDQSTNTVYDIGHNIVDHDGYITASTNDAASFGPVYPTDSPTYPHDSNVFGGNVAASHGIVATAYSASQAPGETCPCVVFETSTNKGALWQRHLVPLTSACVATCPDDHGRPLPRGPLRFASRLDRDGEPGLYHRRLRYYLGRADSGGRVPPEPAVQALDRLREERRHRTGVEDLAGRPRELALRRLGCRRARPGPERSGL